MAERATQVTEIGHLAERLGAKADTHVIYGSPIERVGVTVIPVGNVRYGLGGGGGLSKRGDEGGGAGGGVQVNPVGFIEIKQGRSRFKRILTAGEVLQMTAGVGLFLFLALRGLRSLSSS